MPLPQISIDINADRELEILEQQLGRTIANAFDDFTLDLAEELQKESYRGATLDLAGSWDVSPAVSNGLNVRASVFNSEPTASYRVAGRGPGKAPPLNPLTDWVVAKRIATNRNRARGIAYAIALNIARSGTERFRTQENFMGLKLDGSLEDSSFIYDRLNNLTRIIDALEF